MGSKISVWLWCVGNIPIWKVSLSGFQPSFMLNLPWSSHTLLLGLSINFCPMGFPGGSVVKSLPADTGDAGLTPESGRSPEVGNDNPLQYSRVENPIDRGAWRATVHGVSKSQSQLSTHTQVVESFWPKRAIFKDVVPKSAASGSPGNLSEMPAHRLCPRAVSEWMWQLSGLGVFSEKNSSARKGQSGGSLRIS